MGKKIILVIDLNQNLRLCFREFCALGWDFYHRGQENLIFVKFYSWDWFLLLICVGCWPLVAKRTCIKSGFHDVHALFHMIVHSVHARCLIKCLSDIFSLVWTLMSTKLQVFSCFLIKYMFGSLVVYLTHLTPHVYFSCIAHSHPLAHTFAILVMHWSIPCFFILACHVYLILCSILFCLRIELHFLIHLAPLMHHQHRSFYHLLPFFSP